MAGESGATVVVLERYEPVAPDWAHAGAGGVPELLRDLVAGVMSHPMGTVQMMALMMIPTGEAVSLENHSTRWAMLECDGS